MGILAPSRWRAFTDGAWPVLVDTGVLTWAHTSLLNSKKHVASHLKDFLFIIIREVKLSNPLPPASFKNKTHRLLCLWLHFFV